MKTKQTVAVVSTSALAAGMAQGAIHYSGLQNVAFPCPDVPSTTLAFDLNGDTIYDCFLGFDGATSANSQKPYVGGYPDGPVPNSAVLARKYIDDQARVSYGLPVTPFGTMIDQSYLEPAHTVDSYGGVHSMGYLYQNGDGPYVGDWPFDEQAEGYVGVELYDAGNSTTNFAWVHLIFDPLAAPRTFTLVDYAYEDTPGVGIVAGSTNALGAPIIYSAPASQSVPAGASVNLHVAALAAPAPAYQWKARGDGGTFTNLSDGGVISGATTATLTINGAWAANALDYIVVVTNSLGAATSSPPTTLTLAPPPVTPTPQVLFEGLTARFNVSVAAGFSPTYRWRRNEVDLSDGGHVAGAASAQLTVSALRGADAGNYDVVLTMGSSSVTSAVASLTVLPSAGESTYEMALLAAGPAAYYRLNEAGDPSTNNLLAYDNAGAYNGIYGTNVSNAFGGVAGPRAADGFPGFAATNTAASFIEFDPYSRILLAPWNLNTDTATLLAWVNPADQQVELGSVLFSGYTSTTAAGIQYYYQLNSVTFNRDVGYVWQEGTAASSFNDTQLFPPIGQWSMVAVTVTPRNATVYLFNAGGQASQTNDGTVDFPPFSPFTNQVMSFSKPEFIGTDPGDTVGGRNFYGAIDEVAVFKKALSQEQLQTIYNGALGIAPPQPVTLQITRVGTGLQLSWPTGTLLEAASLAGPWTTNSVATSPYPVTPTGLQKFYRVQVP